MAMEDVGKGDVKKLIDIGVGNSISGYVVKIIPSKDYEGQLNFVMRDKETGKETLWFSAGNVRYMLQDGKIKLGRFTTIKLLDVKTAKNKRSKFQVLQDPDDVVTGLIHQQLRDSASDRENIRRHAENLKNRLNADAEEDDSEVPF